MLGRLQAEISTPLARFGAALAAALLLAALVLAARGDFALVLAPLVGIPAALTLLRRPDLATPLFAFLLYTNAPVVAVQIHGLPFAVAAAAPLLLCAPIARDLLLRGERPVLTAALPLVLVFLAIQFAGALYAIRPEESLEGMVTWLLEGLLLYALLTNAIRTPAVLRQVLWALIAAGAFMGATVGLQKLTGNYESDYLGFAQVDVSGMGFVVDATTEERQPRVGGPLGMPNRFSQIMAILIPIALFQMQASRRRIAKFAAGASLALIMLGFAMGFSRGAAVGLAASFAVMIAMGHVSLRQLAAAGLAGFALVLAVPEITVRLGSLVQLAELATQPGGADFGGADSSTQGRITEMVAGLLIFADHPVIGVGPEMYPRHYPDYARVAGGRVRPNTREAHSLPLHIASENGLLGLAAFGGIFVLTIRDLLRARRRLRESHPDLSLLATGVLLALTVFLTTSVFLHASFIRYQWFLLGLAGATGRVLLQGVPPRAQLVVMRRAGWAANPAQP